MNEAASLHYTTNFLQIGTLPEERQSRFWPFAIGAGAYAALLVAGG